MPVKRRRDKSRSLDSDTLEDLFYGPGTCMFNGAGYLGPYGDGLWRDKLPEVQAIVLEIMRADWERFHAIILTAWADRSVHDIDIAKRFHGDPAQPWAQTEFGDVS